MCLIAIAVGPAFAQEPPRPPDPAPAQYPQPNWEPLFGKNLPPPQPPLPPAPEKVYLPDGTRLAVVLDTPLSTRITKKGESVTFLLSDPVELQDDLVLPPDTRVLATVTEAKRPGRFGKAGALKVKVERIELPTGGAATLVARLESGDPGAVRLQADNNRAADLYSLASWSLQGTLLGAAISGGKGAAIGAGAGAAAALIVLMSRRGPDVYLEPGMPFVIILDDPVELAGADVQAAQIAYERAQGMYTDESGEITSEEAEEELRATGRPQLKRRPKKITP
jgi:hypothetical protein